jgi:O-antigen ligase
MAIAIVIFASLLAFAGILQKLASPDSMYGLRPSPQSLPFGPFVNQHHFAAFMEMTSGLTLGLLLGKGLKLDRKPFLIIAAVLMGMAIVFTGSRGGILSYFGVIAFVFTATYFLRKRSDASGRLGGEATSRTMLVLGTGALVLVVAGSVLYLGGGESLFRGIGLRLGDSDISTGRFQFWAIALKIFAAHPILGSGFDSFGVAYTLYDPGNGLLRVEQAHNDYLQTLSDGGLLGFSCLLAFVFLLFWKGLQTITRAADDLGKSIALGSLAGCVGVAIHSFFDFPLRTPSNAFFFLLLTVLATTLYTIRTDITDSTRT